MNPQDAAKRAAAAQALDALRDGMILGVGTGSTVNALIDQLGPWRGRLAGTVASSVATQQRLEAAGFEVLNLNAIGRLSLYIDGADECDPKQCLIKGGGGALTREKIIAQASDQFVCIIDESKQVDLLGAFPLPVEVLPMALRLVGDFVVEVLGGRPVERQGFVTDNGNHIIDIHGLQIDDPVRVESRLNQMPGVVTNGLFARRSADDVIVGRVTT